MIEWIYWIEGEPNLELLTISSILSIHNILLSCP